MAKRSKLWLGLSSVLTFLLVTCAFVTDIAVNEGYDGFINDALGLKPPTNSTNNAENTYKSAYGDINAENARKLIADENDHNIRVMEEGAVLLKNEGNALPLAATEKKITLFGNSVADPVYATNGGGSVFKSGRGGSLHQAFQDAGFEINETLYNAYVNSGVRRVSSSTPGTSTIGEVPLSFYTNDLKNTFSQYNDAAIIVLTRYGGEGVDLDTKDAAGVPLLSLHQEEKDLLNLVKESGFKKTIVLVNTPFPMDLGFLEDEAYGVDAALQFGAAGDVGYIGVVNLLTGKADPSGHLVDTWAADSTSAPAMRNFGDFTFSNVTGQYDSKYVVYAENIYVGYKYYETRYHDQVLNLHNATSSAGTYASSGESWNYADEMVYPFGAGISYAQFEKTLKDVVWDKETHKVTATVDVKNLGPAEGSAYTGESKATVQLYVSLPWEEGQAEKSAIQLVGYGKTEPLAKGESEEVTIEVDDYLFATYDENAENGADKSKKGCYLFDAGEYDFAIGEDAHDALNNVLAAQNVTGLTDPAGNVVEGDADKVKTIESEFDNQTYATSRETGEVVSNQLKDEMDLNSFIDNAVTYLTRTDWTTYPKSYTGITATDEMKTLIDGHWYAKKSTDPSYDSFTQGVTLSDPINFVELKDVDYNDDETWEQFLNQLTVSDMVSIVGETMGNVAVESINKPANSNTDGPKGISGSYRDERGNAVEGITLYVDETVLASTFNTDLFTEKGKLFAEDALYAGVTMVFGPGADLHRTPYSGRNSEYYSEDSTVSYLTGAYQVRAMQEGGLIAASKHFVGNDQETNRHGVSTFSNEQGFRQGSLRCFEGALSDSVGGGLGVMSCFNRVGMTAGAASKAVQVDILRNEWGFKGVVLTDSSKDSADYVHTFECMMNGTDMFNNDPTRNTSITRQVTQQKDGKLLQQLRLINKHYYYAYSRSNLVNGLSAETQVEGWVPWWKPALYAIDGVLAGLTAAAIVLYVVETYVLPAVSKKKEGKAE